MELIFFKELFYTLTGALVVFSIMEMIWPGVVLAHFNLNWVLIFWLIVGIVITVKAGKQEQNKT